MLHTTTPPALLPDTARKALLSCGIAAAVIFILINLSGAAWPGYNFITQSISDLSAIGAPTRAAAYPLTIIYGVLMTAFGIGIWLLAHGKTAMRMTAALVLAYALFGLVAALVFPNRIGTNAENILYIMPMALSIFSIVAAIGMGAIAFRSWFRFVSLGILALFAAMTLIGIFAAPQSAEPVARAGLQERSMMVFNLLWVVLLARVLWKG